ncbi:uncharacterized protein LACBIDRAFT_321401 [Laccaria bicolor S238N-H82]|uniref:Predicted protein n=1 Tax=Laccaria bicolor (strain S238N-H82 / ATCC MYA-4686) TaxID=486041 RepID=B0CQ19_LACBS|nr:uncharacterized protein LACBIDRAFT_321401 [Laccaria bicolor S238N-H82]EDR16163.1 predicted protein [Laccaria bicolor S238N-H82]|eukprot:XP_001874371.1 predicted protein [Laccaria bicolor S238N-H82]
MLVLQILTAALTISFAKANPVAIDVRNWDNSAADGAFKREELAVMSATSSYAEYIPSPTETSLTLRYYQERATCLDQFVWYCQVPAGACIAALGGLATPVNLWSLVPCAIAAVCGSVALVFGALCCNGIIKNCDGSSFSSSISSASRVTSNVMATLNGGGGHGDAPFNRDCITLNVEIAVTTTSITCTTASWLVLSAALDQEKQGAVVNRIPSLMTISTTSSIVNELLVQGF